MFKEGNNELALEIITKWYVYLKEHLINNKKSELNSFIKIDDTDLKELTILKNGYIDLVFENTFYIENSFKFLIKNGI